MHRYKYTIIFLLTFIFAWAIGRLSVVEHLASGFAQTNTLLFTLFAGAMYSFSFTSGLAVILFTQIPVVTGTLLPLALIGAFGSMLADLFIFRFVKDILLEELSPHMERVLEHATRRKSTRFLLQCVGAIVIMSPFPDEIGLAFMNLSHISYWRLVPLVFVLDTIGVYLLILAVTNF